MCAYVRAVQVSETFWLVQELEKIKFTKCFSWMGDDQNIKQRLKVCQ